MAYWVRGNSSLRTYNDTNEPVNERDYGPFETFQEAYDYVENIINTRMEARKKYWPKDTLEENNE